MIDQLDDILKKENVKFDSSILTNESICYFNDGLFVAEVRIVNINGMSYVDIFKAEKKLWK